MIKWRRMKGGACSTYRGEERLYRVSVGKTEGKRPLGRPRHRWENNILIHLQELGWGEWSGMICLRIWTVGEIL
jgi:hypothetical protein